jgi:hypothetical protein
MVTAKVEVSYRAKSDSGSPPTANDGYVFKATGAQQADGSGGRYGGLIYTYSDKSVRVYAPNYSGLRNRLLVGAIWVHPSVGDQNSYKADLCLASGSSPDAATFSTTLFDPDKNTFNTDPTKERSEFYGRKLGTTAEEEDTIVLYETNCKLTTAVWNNYPQCDTTCIRKADSEAGNGLKKPERCTWDDHTGRYNLDGEKDILQVQVDCTKIETKEECNEDKGFCKWHGIRCLPHWSLPVNDISKLNDDNAQITDQCSGPQARFDPPENITATNATHKIQTITTWAPDVDEKLSVRTFSDYNGGNPLNEIKYFSCRAQLDTPIKIEYTWRKEKRTITGLTGATTTSELKAKLQEGYDGISSDSYGPFCNMGGTGKCVEVECENNCGSNSDPNIGPNICSESTANNQDQRIIKLTFKNPESGNINTAPVKCTNDENMCGIRGNVPDFTFTIDSTDAGADTIGDPQPFKSSLCTNAKEVIQITTEADECINPSITDNATCVAAGKTWNSKYEECIEDSITESECIGTNEWAKKRIPAYIRF